MDSCRTCHAVWSEGQWTPGCPECGGGALQLRCGRCLGTCDQTQLRAVLDSNDAHLAHWNGGCSPGPEQLRRFVRLVELVSADEGRPFTELAIAQAPGALGVLADWLLEHDVPTGREWLAEVVSLARRSGRPLRAVLIG